jgi:hypothetical protein
MLTPTISLLPRFSGAAAVAVLQARRTVMVLSNGRTAIARMRISGSAR